ncbi:deoxyhypusine synthase isoform X4 [Durio zibethinus]|uniref:Deoxyhypusine synthase isoform X4 n=1 Tax=Durio zibethinus TaxID=66656 RepID=A0A6P6AJF1_DURZI|nr:deoxyhypusine synthase isoform X4 [Durio zibethinus]
MEDKLINSVHSTVFKESDSLEGKCTKIEGYDFNQGINYSKLLKSMLSTGFQASNLGEAMEIVNEMLDWRLADESINEDCSEEEKDPAYRESVRCKVFLGFTSNLISSGVRDTVRYLTEHHMNVLWTPSKLIARLGKEINNESSYLYWAYKNKIPVFCPGLTDGSLGDMLYFHSFRSPGLIIDVVQDIRAMNSEAVHASPRKTGMIILGGGLPKHHICNANMMRNGADYAVYINTAQEFDGSDSGARPDEAVSWGKIRGSAKMVKTCTNWVFPLHTFLASTFIFISFLALVLFPQK